MPLDKQKLDTTLPNSGIDSFQTAKDFFLFENFYILKINLKKIIILWKRLQAPEDAIR